jgi:hypothetical protein
MRNGVLYLQVNAGQYTKEKGYSFWPTPTVNDAKNSAFPPSQLTKRKGRYGTVISWAMRQGLARPGQFANPEFWEWLMMFPIGATKLKPLGIANVQSWRQLHSEYF